MSRLRDRIRSRRGQVSSVRVSARAPEGAGPNTPDSLPHHGPNRAWRRDASRLRPAVINEVEFIPAEGATEEDIEREKKALADRGIKVRVRESFADHVDRELRAADGELATNPLEGHPEILSATVNDDVVTLVVAAGTPIGAETDKLARDLARHHGAKLRQLVVRMEQPK